jgi:hypothetical protein
VNGNGAYGSEMNDVVLFENALRATVPARPDPAIGTALVPRLAQVARAATLEAEPQTAPRAATRPRSRLALVARVGIAVALIPLVLAGLAFAGVTVPGPARDVFHSVGITLPNQPAKSAVSRVRQGPEPARAHGSKTTTGQTTSKGSSDAAHQHALQQHSKAKGKALGHEQGKAIGLNGSTPPGQAKDKQTGPPAHSNAGGNSSKGTTTHTPPGHANPPVPGDGPGNGNAGGDGNGNANGHSK